MPWRAIGIRIDFEKNSTKEWGAREKSTLAGKVKKRVDLCVLCAEQVLLLSLLETQDPSQVYSSCAWGRVATGPRVVVPHTSLSST